jgi:hypothetical protein
MTDRPYNAARRVFWIVDNGSSHGGVRAAQRLRDRYVASLSCLLHSPESGEVLEQQEASFA